MCLLACQICDPIVVLVLVPDIAPFAIPMVVPAHAGDGDDDDDGLLFCLYSLNDSSQPRTHAYAAPFNWEQVVSWMAGFAQSTYGTVEYYSTYVENAAFDWMSFLPGLNTSGSVVLELVRSTIAFR